MAAPSAPRAGGFFLALLILAGAVGGFLRGELTTGILVGLGTGIAVTLALWLIDRGRSRP